VRWRFSTAPPVKLANMLAFLQRTTSGAGYYAGSEITKISVKLAGALAFLHRTTSEAG
jgi:hypothetical protein